MDISTVLHDKTIKGKEQTVLISAAILENKISVQELLTVAESAKDAAKATCIEALEYASKIRPAIADNAVLDFVVASLHAKAPRIKWESAKVIGNIAACFPDKLDEAVNGLLINTEHSGTVVRWSAAFALGEIVQLKHPRSSDLAKALEAISNREEKNSIRKIYQKALKSALK
jgi:HEAT repeat protein